MAARRSVTFRVMLSQVGPVHDPAFAAAPQAVRDEVIRWVMVFGLKEKDRELAAGLDRHGVPLAPVSAATAAHRDSEMGPADPSAPPLMPAYAVSRTRLLLDARSTPRRDGAEFFWQYDAHTGGSWGKILDYHRRGIGRRGNRVKRDVIGISPESLSRVRDQVMARWSEYKRNAFTYVPRLTVAEVPPVRIGVRGRTDFENFTYGIGGGGGVAASRRALAVGGSTGFFQRRPGQGWTAYGGPDRSVLADLVGDLDPTGRAQFRRLPDPRRDPDGFVAAVKKRILKGARLAGGILDVYRFLGGVL